MAMANFYIKEKQYVHKLFKVLVPRFENLQSSYTRMYKVPRDYPGSYLHRTVLELRGNPYPSLLPDRTSNQNLLHNVLLNEAKRDYRREKYAQIAAQLVSPELSEDAKESVISESAENEATSDDASSAKPQETK